MARRRPLVARGGLSAAPLKVAVSVLPLESMVQQIGGEAVEVRSLQREGDSCSVFEPRPSAVSWLAEAEIFFRTGVGYESVIMEKVASRFSNLKVYDLREALGTLPGAIEHDHAAHACPHCGSHAGSESADPHIWMSPALLMELADAIATQLAAAYPDGAASFLEGAVRFKERASALDARLDKQLAPFKGKAFYIYHPALGYFAQRYGLEQIAIAGQGQEPSARELHRLISEARSSGVRAVFVQPQENQRHAQIVAQAIGAQLVEIDPMRLDWEANLQSIGEAMANALGHE